MVQKSQRRELANTCTAPNALKSLVEAFAANNKLKVQYVFLQDS